MYEAALIVPLDLGQGSFDVLKRLKTLCDLIVPDLKHKEGLRVQASRVSVSTHQTHSEYIRYPIVNLAFSDFQILQAALKRCKHSVNLLLNSYLKHCKEEGIEVKVRAFIEPLYSLETYQALKVQLHLDIEEQHQLRERFFGAQGDTKFRSIQPTLEQSESESEVQYVTYDDDSL